MNKVYYVRMEVFMEPLLKDKQHIVKSLFLRLAIAALFQLLLYLVQYLLVPVIAFPDPKDENLSGAIVMITTFVFAFVGMYFFVPNVLYWFATMPIYYWLVSLYHPENIYGINFRDDQFAYLSSTNVLTISIIVLLLEIFVWIIVMLLFSVLRLLKKK